MYIGFNISFMYGIYLQEILFSRKTNNNINRLPSQEFQIDQLKVSRNAFSLTQFFFYLFQNL